MAGRSLGEAFVELRMSTGRVSRDLVREMRDLGGRAGTILGRGLTKGFAGIATAGLAAAATSALGQSLVGLAGAAVAVAGALAPAAGIIAGLPAAAAAGAIAVGTLQLALQGVGDAFKAFEDPEAFAQALKELSPAAREFAVAARDLALGPLTDLQQAVQEEFFLGFADTMQRLADDLFPRLRDQLPGLSRGLGELAQGFAGSFIAQGGGDAIDKLLGSMRAGIADLNEPLQNAGQAFSTLISGGAGPLERVMLAVGDAIDGISNKINALGPEGIEKIINTAMDVLSQVGTILANVGAGIAGVFRAGQDAGGGLLASLERVTGEFARFVNSAEGQETLGNFFSGINELLSAALPLLGALAGLIGNVIAPLLGDLASAFGPALLTIVDSIGAALTAAAPGINAVAVGLSALIQSVAPALGPLGEAIGNALAAFSPGLVAIVEAFVDALTVIAPTVRPLADALSKVLQAVAPLIPLLADLVAIGLTALADILVTLAEPLGVLIEALVEALQPLLPVLQEAFVALAEALGVVATSLVEAILPVLPVLVEALVLVLEAIIPILPQVAAFLAQLIEGLAPILPVLIDAFLQLVTALLPLVPVVLQLLEAFLPLLPIFVNLIETLLPPLVALIVENIDEFTRLAQMLADILEPVLSAIATALEAIAPVLEPIFGLFSTAFSGVVDILNPIVDVIQGMADVIQGVVDAAKAAKDFLSFGGGSGGGDGSLKDFFDSGGKGLPRNARGGIFTGPELGWYGEDGAEAIIPLTKPKRAAELMDEAGLTALAMSRAGSGQQDELAALLRALLQATRDQPTALAAATVGALDRGSDRAALVGRVR